MKFDAGDNLWDELIKILDQLGWCGMPFNIDAPEDHIQLMIIGEEKYVQNFMAIIAKYREKH